MRLTLELKTGLVLIVWAFVGVSGGLVAQRTPSPIAGKWQGSVTTDIGEMKLEVALAEKAGTVTGEIVNPHGTFVIRDGKLIDGAWVLPFETDDGAKGRMKGRVTGDDFSGEWDFHPIAVGTFALKRVK